MAIMVKDSKNNTVILSDDEWNGALKMASGHSEALPFGKHESVCFYHLYGVDAGDESVVTDDGSWHIIPKKHATKLARALNRVLTCLPPLGSATDPEARIDDEIKTMVLKLWHLASHGNLTVLVV
jgi:hypothetical protein